MDEQQEMVQAHVERGFAILEGRQTYDITAYRLGDRAAEAEFKAALSLEPNCCLALIGRGICLRLRQDFAEAIIVFRRASDVRPNEGRPWWEAGLAFFHAGENRALPEAEP
jgi:Flp pilus assembly protein TadD